MITEQRIRYEANYDPFINKYKLTNLNTCEEKKYELWKDFKNDFFTLKDFLLVMERKDNANYYLELSIKLEKMKLLSPFNLITLLGLGGTLNSEKKRIQLGE